MMMMMMMMMAMMVVRFGRKKTVLGFFGVKITGILMSWFGANYTAFVIGRLLVGGGQVGFFISGFVLGQYLLTSAYKIIVTTFRSLK